LHRRRPTGCPRRLNRWWGTNREGGAFEIMTAAMVCYRDGRVAGLEVWEPEDLDAAVARFEGLDRPEHAARGTPNGER